MFTLYKDIVGLNIHSSTKLGNEINIIVEILNKFNILEILKFFNNIEQYFNIPIFYDIITSNNNFKCIKDIIKNNLKKQHLIIKFIKVIKTYFLFDNILQLLLTKQLNPGFPIQKILINPFNTTKYIKPLMVGQVYGQYQGSVLPFYAHTSSWYIRTGLLSDVKLLIIFIIIQKNHLIFKMFLLNYLNSTKTF